MFLEIFTYSILFFLLIITSSFFSGSEVAFFSLKNKDIVNITPHNYINRRLLKLLKNPSQLLITILICNTLVNVSAAVVAAILTLQIIQYFQSGKIIALLIEVVFVTLVILIFGEITPKVIARKYTLQYARFAAIPITFFTFILSPFAKMFEYLMQHIKSFLNYQRKSRIITEDDLKQLTEIVNQQGEIDEPIKQLFRRIGELSFLNAKDILVPRMNMVAIDIVTSLKRLKDVIRFSNSLYIPVFNKSIDNVIGVIYSKDILKVDQTQNDSDTEYILSILKKPLFVPETKNIIELLREFQSSKINVAIVVDEHGGTVGMVTLQDILNCISNNPLKTTDSKLIKVIDSKTYLVEGTALVKDIEKLLNVKLIDESAKYSTIGGLVLHIAGKIPELYDKFVYRDIVFQVYEVKHNRIQKIKITVV